jgi:putative (di)nucleoside polyphosphate hydrolase
VAIFRELQEEIGTDAVEIMGEHEEWLTYDLPEDLVGKIFKGRYRGQRQRWFALRFLGVDANIQLNADPHPEFDDWKWVDLAEVPALAVDFKRTIYERLAADFARYVPLVRSIAR